MWFLHHCYNRQFFLFLIMFSLKFLAETFRISITHTHIYIYSYTFICNWYTRTYIVPIYTYVVYMDTHCMYIHTYIWKRIFCVIYIAYIYIVYMIDIQNLDIKIVPTFNKRYHRSNIIYTRDILYIQYTLEISILANTFHSSDNWQSYKRKRGKNNARRQIMREEEKDKFGFWPFKHNSTSSLLDVPQ